MKVALLVLVMLFASIPAYAQYGPSPTITCPAGATRIDTNTNASSFVSGFPAGTTFCFAVGLHTPIGPIYVKSNQKFYGEFGATVDGTNMLKDWDALSTSVFRGWNCGPSGCSDVTIRNLIVRNLSAYNCIGAVGAGSDRWVIDHNEIYGCNYGVNLGWNCGSRVTANYIHDNVTVGSPFTGGYGANEICDTVFEGNKLERNGRTQKVVGTRNVTFRNNLSRFEGNAIWYDGDNIGALIEGNVIEDCAEEGIFFEISAFGIIRNNTVKRCGEHGIFISTSRDTEVYGNILTNNFRGISLFVNCENIHPPGMPYLAAIGWDLRNMLVRDNTITTSTRAGEWSATHSTYACSAAQISEYATQKNLKFERNHYVVPSPTSGFYWMWSNILATFSQWKLIPQDSEGTVTDTGGTEPPPPPPPPPFPTEDTEKPQVTFGSIVQSGRSDNVTITVGATDNIGVTSFTLTVDTTVIAKTPGTYTVKVRGTGGHSAIATATDAVGLTTTVSKSFVMR